ncbi:E3 ubiquitin-protein ligase bre1 [Phytophthora pseudosyringae]|uniref:E3 ubiquitin-protein ligase bre1 n=1 Tax=Phytophthora pseudosyringae TaxID=221518 RepID=A0A8T1VN21_9STRA|nr:E3 ubiquitin-protein ligase bre1 [Phytophthora pseudosyringae]
MARDTSSRKRRRGGSSTKRQRPDPQETPDQLYAPEDAVLVLGDGDFSFSRGLVKHRGTGRGVVATSFDSESQVHSKYPNAQECVAAVRSAHGLVLHDVDATKLLELPQQVKTGTGLKTAPDFFQYIVFNFPHSGQQRVHINRALLLNFFESARDRLTVHGEAHVTLKTRPPYSNWFIEDQAKAAGFVMKERRKLDIKLFPGYRHRTTDPQAKKFEPDLCVTFVFVVNRSKYPFQKSRAALNAASAEIAATEANEQHDLASAILNIAKAKAATSKKEKSVVRNAAAVPSPQPAKKSRKKTPAPIAVRPDLKEQVEPTRPTAQAKVNHGERWKPLHRRAGGTFS